MDCDRVKAQPCAGLSLNLRVLQRTQGPIRSRHWRGPLIFSLCRLWRMCSLSKLADEIPGTTASLPHRGPGLAQEGMEASMPGPPATAAPRLRSSPQACAPGPGKASGYQSLPLSHSPHIFLPSSPCPLPSSLGHPNRAPSPALPSPPSA